MVRSNRLRTCVRVAFLVVLLTVPRGAFAVPVEVSWRAIGVFPNGDPVGTFGDSASMEIRPGLVTDRVFGLMGSGGTPSVIAPIEYMITVIPEPSSGAPLAIGLGVVCGRQRLRRPMASPSILRAGISSPGP